VDVAALISLAAVALGCSHDGNLDLSPVHRWQGASTATLHCPRATVLLLGRALDNVLLRLRQPKGPSTPRKPGREKKESSISGGRACHKRGVPPSALKDRPEMETLL